MLQVGFQPAEAAARHRPEERLEAGAEHHPEAAVVQVRMAAEARNPACNQYVLKRTLASRISTP